MPGQRRVQVLSAHLVTTPRIARLPAKAKGRGGNVECAGVAGNDVLSVDDDLASHMVTEGMLRETCDIEMIMDGEDEQGTAPSPKMRRSVEDACASLGLKAEEQKTSDHTVAFVIRGSLLEDEHEFKFGLALDGHRVIFAGGAGSPSQWDCAQTRLFVDAWNRDKKFFKARVDDDGGLAVVMDVDLGHVSCDLEDMKHFVCLFEDGISIFVLDVARMAKQAFPGARDASSQCS